MQIHTCTLQSRDYNCLWVTSERAAHTQCMPPQLELRTHVLSVQEVVEVTCEYLFAWVNSYIFLASRFTEETWRDAYPLHTVARCFLQLLYLSAAATYVATQSVRLDSARVRHYFRPHQRKQKPRVARQGDINHETA